MAAVDVVIAATPREWATRLTEWITDHGEQARLRDHYVFDRAEALERSYDCLVIDGASSLLDPMLVDQLHSRQRTVVAVVDPDEPGSYRRLCDLGADRVLNPSDAPQAMLAAIVEVATTDRRFHEAVSDLDSPSGDLAASRSDVPPPPHTGLGSVLTVVTGAIEGVGATEVAVETAACLRARGETTVLVDADLIAPSLAQRLQTPLTANVYAAIDAVAHRLGDLSTVLTPVDRGGFELLGGVEHPKHWQHLAVDDVLLVFAALRGSHEQVVASVGSQLEALPSERHELARCLLRAADRVVVVAEPSPTGLVRLSRWMVDAVELTDPGRVHVVCNRSDQRDVRPQVESELLRTLACAGIHHVPSDRKVARAHAAGTLAQNGRFTKAIAAIVEAAVPRAGRRSPAAPTEAAR